MEVVSLDAKGLSSHILDSLRHFGLDPKGIVFQGYDGASVMSGRCSGVQHVRSSQCTGASILQELSRAQ